METTVSSIIDLLARKHRKDIFVPQCKTGSTWMAKKGDLFIFDAWALEKSWTRPFATGYEVKLTRQDFVTDRKWVNYLDYCHSFYFVCPQGLIQPTELPPEAGLYYVSKTGKKLFLKKKSTHRFISLPPEILYYVLFWRAKVIDRQEVEVESEREYWERWLKNKKISQNFGWHVSRKIRQIIEEEIVKVKRRNAELLAENEKLSQVKETVESWGWDVDQLSKWGIENKLREKTKVLSLVEEKQELAKRIDMSIELLKELRGVL